MSSKESKLAGMLGSLLTDQFHETLSKNLDLLKNDLKKNMPATVEKIVETVKQGGSIFVYGSGHSAIFAQELYHRAGGVSFVVPMLAEFLMPLAGPPLARKFERTPQVANYLLKKHQVTSKDMVWIFSNSGLNSSSIDLAIACRAEKIHVTAFTSLNHSKSFPARHSSGKKLYEVVDQIIDTAGVPGDACVTVGMENQSLKAGPLSSMLGIFASQAILLEAAHQLEIQNISCVYTSVNTPGGEDKNKKIEAIAMKRDWLLRE